MSAAADDKDRLAQEFSGWKGLVEQLLGGPTMKSADRLGNGARAGGREVWSGPAAERFTGELRRLRTSLERLPGGFLATAQNLRETAKDLRSKEHH
ncbi:hypothetical protein [Streptomyces sp. NPDC097640]|uniref:hypothetical protein n=1 Tax=Streptomyces sp. NPDC097640 TaxID=3157229 RepID=UPI0033297B26